jgi:hypothetical protein
MLRKIPHLIAVMQFQGQYVPETHSRSWAKNQFRHYISNCNGIHHCGQGILPPEGATWDNEAHAEPSAAARGKVSNVEDAKMTKLASPEEYKFGPDNEGHGWIHEPSFNEWVKLEWTAEQRLIGVHWSTRYSESDLEKVFSIIQQVEGDLGNWIVRATPIDSGAKEIEGVYSKVQAAVFSQVGRHQVSLLQAFNDQEAIQWRRHGDASQLSWLGSPERYETAIWLLVQTGSPHTTGLTGDVRDQIEAFIK